MEKQRELGHLADVLNAATLAKEFLGEMTRASFEEDRKTQSAVIRQIEIIGEATKRISENFRKKFPKVPWKEMAGMRDVLIHQYEDIDLDQVWKAVTVSIPGLIPLLQTIIQQEEKK